MKFHTIGNNDHSRIVPLFTDESNIIDCNCKKSYMLIIIISGSLIATKGKQKSFIESPALLCLNNNDNITVEQSNNLKTKTIYFQPSVINSKFGFDYPEQSDIESFSETESQDLIWLSTFVDESLSDGRYIKLGPSMILQVVRLFELLSNELDTQPDGFWPCRSRSFFLEILFSIHSNQKRYSIYKSSISDISSPLDSILLFIHSHYMEKITLSDLVNRFSINRTKLNNLFVTGTGFTAIKYLINLRVKLACLILRDTQRPIKEVAYQAGFNDLVHFGRTFKNQLNMTPLDYRDKNCWL